MQAIKNQFEKCKYIFVQYKFIIPLLIVVTVAIVGIGFTYGMKIGSIETKVERVEDSYKRLENIEKGIDSLLKKD